MEVNSQGSGKYIGLSLLLVVIGIAMAVLDFMVLHSQARALMIIFGLLALLGLWSTVYNILKFSRQRAVRTSGTNSTGTYLKHIAYAMDVDAPYWELHYSYTDENGIKREAKSLIDDKRYIFALKQAGTFPLKRRGKYATIAVDEAFINQVVGRHDETFVAETVNNTAKEQCAYQARIRNNGNVVT